IVFSTTDGCSSGLQGSDSSPIEHQTHICGIWDQEYEAHHHQQQPPQQDASEDEMDREIDAALQFFTPGGSSSQ
ncbi:hypothetical protein A2U01_0105007, partial [Trifolium medium]|nr:hypothetical protein [Trifolium medium]